MRLRVRLKSLVLLALFSSCVVLYNILGVHLGGLLEDATTSGDSKGHHRMARITADDLLSIGRFPDPSRHTSDGQTIVNTSDITNLALSSNSKNGKGLDSQAPLVGPLTLLHKSGGATGAAEENNENPSGIGTSGTPQQKGCNGGCHFRRLREESLAALAQIRSKKVGKLKDKDGRIYRTNPCDQACRLAKLKNHGLNKGGYSSRVQVENVTLPESWTVTRELVDRLSSRRSRVHDVCKKYDLQNPTKSYQPNSWEFLINAKYGLVWCNVFKAASSTWFYNFNLLAGFSEQELLHAKETPIQLARKRYARPTVDELKQVMNSTRQPLSFMIARHPLQRLVSGYRDKILSGNRYYSKLSRTILRQYKDMTAAEKEKPKPWTFFGKSTPKAIVPSFPQFVQFLLDETAKGHRLDEHWIPINEFCTPCLVDFDVFAKVETMEEDGNYIIFSAGIQDVIKPKRINRSRNEPTDAVADKFICQLSQNQMDGLLRLYRLDIELFDYDVSKYVNCTRS